MRINNVTPTFDRVLLEKVNEEKTEGGLFVPITAEDNNTYKAKIVAVGPDVHLTKHNIGTIVIVGRYSGVELSAGSGVVIVNVKDILGTVEE